MKQSLSIKLGQQLKMTPQLQQAIRLLQLSALELEQEIQDPTPHRRVPPSSPAAALNKAEPEAAPAVQRVRARSLRSAAQVLARERG